MKRLFPAVVVLGFWMLTADAFAQSSTDQWFQRRKASEDLVLLRNEAGLIPIQHLDSGKLTVVSLGTDVFTPFQEYMRYYSEIDFVSIAYDDQQGPIQLSNLIRRETPVVIAWHEPERWAAQTTLVRDRWKAAIQDDLEQYRKSVVVVVGPAGSLKQFPELPSAGHLLLTRGATRIHESLAAQVIMGAEPCYGRLTEDVSRFFLRGNGLRINGGLRLRYSYPEAVGWDGDDLANRIDSIVMAGIGAEAFPGCQVLIAKDGQVVFHQSYGHHTYDEQIQVSELDLYDFASLTKVTGPLPILMRQVDEARIQLDAPFAAYWPDFYEGDKAMMTVREVLAHQAGLVPYITFYKELQRSSGKFRWRTIHADSSSRYPVEVYQRMYLHRRWRKRMMKEIGDEPLLPEREYVYSGMSFLIYPDLIRNLTGSSLDLLLQKDFLTPLGASRLQFNPIDRVGLESIVPTEYDSAFRQSLVHGYVHDENAAMLGGISGNAGLFGCTHDLAKLLQMFLNDGLYGGERYLSAEVIGEFTDYQYPGNRRGLGFDKPPREPGEETYISGHASPASYGHSGFTGTFFWVDPREDLFVIFLSNRVHPTRNNRKLYDMKIREAIHDACYTAKPASWTSGK